MATYSKRNLAHKGKRADGEIINHVVFYSGTPQAPRATRPGFCYPQLGSCVPSRDGVVAERERESSLVFFSRRFLLVLLGRVDMRGDTFVRDPVNILLIDWYEVG